MSYRSCLLLSLVMLVLANCTGANRQNWLERRDLAAIAHCPPPGLGRCDTDASQQLAWWPR